jgi:methyl-accepting chemotaxis protein
MLKNIKITANTKLIISSVFFLAPVAVMFCLIISVFSAADLKVRKEQQGIACLKPAVAILQAASALTPDYSSGDPSSLNNEVLNNEVISLLETLESKLEKNTGFFDVPEQKKRERSGGNQPADPQEEIGPHRLVSDIRGMLMNMNDGGFEQRQKTHAELIRSIGKLIIRIGDSSGLTADPGSENQFLINISFRSLPQTLTRLTQIGNTSRAASFRTDFSRTAKPDIEACLILLKEVDYPESTDSLQMAEWRFSSSLTENGGASAEQILSGIKNYRASIEELIAALETAAASDPALYGPVILEKLNRVNSSVFALQDASISRIDTMLRERINGCRVNLIRFIIIAVLASVPAFIIVIMINISIFRSISRLGRLFKGLYNNDLSVAVKIKSRDEFGEMMSAFDRFLENLRTAFVSFSRSASLVSAAAGDLSASAKDISTAANEQSTNIAEIVSTIEDNKNLSGQISLKTGEVVNLMTKTQELSQRGSELWEINQDMMQDIWNQNTKIVENIMNLADMISHIDEIISAIDVMADQTKLIAFNASLEASSSGEEGARFAVIAGEIRRFAGEVAESTDEIKEKIEEIQSASQKLIEKANEGSQQIDEGYDRMMEQKTVFENIFEVSQSTAVSSRHISDLSRQQEFAFSQIFQALKELSAGVKQFVAATTSTSKIADNLNIMSMELRETADKYRTDRTSEKETGGK